MSPNPSAETDSPPSPSPTPSPTPPTVNRLFAAFRPTTPPSSDPSPSSTTEETPPTQSQPPADGTAEPTWSTDAPPSDQASAAESSDTLSIGKGGRVSKAGLRAAVGTGFRQVCKLIAIVAAAEEERQYGLWQPEPDDIEDVARPVTNLVYRRLPEEARGGDAIDLIALGLALAGYVGKNLQRRAVLRAYLQENGGGASPEPS